MESKDYLAYLVEEIHTTVVGKRQTYPRIERPPSRRELLIEMAVNYF